MSGCFSTALCIQMKHSAAIYKHSLKRNCFFPSVFERFY
uniref:Uncharacterized protein n=1 Tax=Anguilla anguilla TaxID=7936 RepID=A0A0E9SLN3_ANGAN